MIRLLSIFLLLGAIPIEALPIEPFPREEVHRIYLIHPGISMTEAVECQLVAVKDREGDISEYYMDVESVVCLKSLCKVVTVRISWDRLGFYDGYSLAQGIQLEKEKGKPFNSSDYQKLDQILSDPDSPLQHVDIFQIVKYSKDESAVDGISGATVLIDTSATVTGAVLTCYSLWHWTHGEINGIIRQITGDASSPEDLIAYLDQGDRPHKIFALEQLTGRLVFDKPSIQAVKELASREEKALLKLALGYFEHGAPGIYYPALEELFTAGNTHQRILYLNSMQKAQRKAPAGFYDSLSRHLPELDSYQEVDLFLNLLENRVPSSKEVITQAMKLLERDIFISRRAYWHLEMQELSPSQRQKLEDFKVKNQEYL